MNTSQQPNLYMWSTNDEAVNVCDIIHIHGKIFTCCATVNYSKVNIVDCLCLVTGTR